MTDRPTDRQTNQQRDRPDHREKILPTTLIFQLRSISISNPSPHRLIDCLTVPFRYFTFFVSLQVFPTCFTLFQCFSHINGYVPYYPFRYSAASWHCYVFRQSIGLSDFLRSIITAAISTAKKARNTFTYLPTPLSASCARPCHLLTLLMQTGGNPT